MYIESSCVNEDSDVRHGEPIVEEHDDAFEDVESLVVEVLPVPALQGTRPRDVVPDVRFLGISICVSGHLELRLLDLCCCSTRVSVMQAKKAFKLTMEDLPLLEIPTTATWKQSSLYWDAPFGGVEFFRGRRYDGLNSLLPPPFCLFLRLRSLSNLHFGSSGRLFSQDPDSIGLATLFFGSLLPSLPLSSWPSFPSPRPGSSSCVHVLPVPLAQDASGPPLWQLCSSPG